MTATNRPSNVAWGAKVSPLFLSQAMVIVHALRLPMPLGLSWLLTCIAFETGRTFSASVRNMAGSGATGLIQFMPATAIYFFWEAAEIAAWTKEQRKAKGIEATDRLAAMTAEDQLKYVLEYFKPYAGRLNSLEDLYMAILWPAAIGKPVSYVLWDKETRPTTYRQNSGLDLNKDGAITKEEASRTMNRMLVEGTKPENLLV